MECMGFFIRKVVRPKKTYRATETKPISSLTVKVIVAFPW